MEHDIAMEDAKLIKTWGLVMVLFLVIALIAIGFILAPVKHSTGLGISGAAPAISKEGLAARVEGWKEYPAYNIGFGFIAVWSFISAGYTYFTMQSLKRRAVIEN